MFEDPCTVLEGDCLDLLPTLPAGSVDCVVTSPPYAEQRKKQYGGVPEGDYPAWTVAWMEALKPALKPKGSVLINIREHIRDGQISDYVLKTRLAVREAGWIECEELIWVKPNGIPLGSGNRPKRSWERVLWFSPNRRPWVDLKVQGRPSKRVGIWVTPNMNQWAGKKLGIIGEPGRARCRDYIEVNLGDSTRTGHPAVYPVPLAEWMVNLVCPSSGTVCDPFTGSGTTGVAALNTGRRFIGIEREPAYCKIARERLAASRTLWNSAA